MSNRFLSARGADLFNGSENIFVNRITLRDMDRSLPVKTNGQGTLVAEKLDIADVNGLQAQLNGKLANPLDADFNYQEYKALNIDETQYTQKAGSVASPVGHMTLYAGLDGEFHQIDSAGVDSVVRGDVFNQPLNTFNDVAFNIARIATKLRISNPSGFIELSADNIDRYFDLRNVEGFSITSMMVINSDGQSTIDTPDLQITGNMQINGNAVLGALFPATMYTLPSVRGSLDQVLKTNNAGIVSWDDSFDQPLNTFNDVEFKSVLTSGYFEFNDGGDFSGRFSADASTIKFEIIDGMVITQPVGIDATATILASPTVFITNTLRPLGQFRLGPLFNFFYTMPAQRSPIPNGVILDTLGNGVLSWAARNQWNQDLNTTNNVVFNQVRATQHIDIRSSVDGYVRINSPSDNKLDIIWYGDMVFNQLFTFDAVGSSLINTPLLNITGAVSGNSLVDPTNNTYRFGSVGTGLNGDSVSVNIAVAGAQRISCNIFETRLQNAPVRFNVGANTYTMPQVRGSAKNVMADELGTGTVSWQSLTSLLPQQAFGEMHFNGNAAVTAFGASDTYAETVGTRTAGLLANWSMGAQVMTYTGVENRIVKIDSAVSWEAGGVQDYIYEIGIHVNNVICQAGQVRSKLDASAIYPSSASVSCFATVSTNDFIGLKVRNKQNTQSARIIDLSFNVITLKDTGVSMNIDDFNMVDEVKE